MILNLLIDAYRAFPFRPHCNARAGIHTALCRLIMPGIEARHPGGRTCRD